MNTRQGVTAGLMLALILSVSVGNATDSVWMGFVTLVFALLIVAGIAAVMVRANHGRTNQ